MDYRELNNVTVEDVYSLPRINDTLDPLRLRKFLSSMDVKSGYCQIEVDKRGQEKTAFITPGDLYNNKVMIFGLCSAPATFQRLIDTILVDLN